MSNGMSEDIILACLLHDVVQELIKVDHGWWGAQMFEPYVSEKTSFAIRYHQALRFYPDHQAGWISEGWDPTHNRRTDADYLVIAVGRDYADAAPLSGTYDGAAATNTLAVDKHLDLV